MSASGAQTDVEHMLRVLLDRQEIHDVLVRYCRGIDRRDAELVISAFHDDATDNHSGTELPFRDAIRTLRGDRTPHDAGKVKTTQSKWTSHNLCNELIQVDGDVAHCESYLIAYNRLEHEGQELDWILGGRYVDRFERRDGSWRIARRTVVYDWQRFDEVRDAPAGLSSATYIERAMRGTRTPADFSYQELRRDSL